MRQIKTKAMEQIGEAWDRIERSLAAKGPYMLGERFSAADLPVVMLSNWQQAQPEMLAKRPNLRRLVELVGRAAGGEARAGAEPAGGLRFAISSRRIPPARWIMNRRPVLQPDSS